MSIRSKSGDEILGSAYWESCERLSEREIANLKELSACFYEGLGEGASFTLKTAAHRAIQFLQRIDETDPSFSLVILHTIILRGRLKDWAGVLATPIDGKFKIKKYQNHVNYYFGMAKARLKDFAGSEQCFAKLDGKIPASWERGIATSRKSAEASQKSVAFPLEDFRAAIVEGAPSRAADHLLNYYLRRSVVADKSVLTSLMDLIGRVLINFELNPDLKGDADMDGYAPVSDFSDVVFTCGFSWSGSGAVSDFLRGYAAIKDVSRSELIWTQGRRRFISLFDCLCEDLTPQVLLTFLTGTVLGSPMPDVADPEHSNDHVWRSSMLGLCVNNAISPMAYFGVVEQFLERLAAAKGRHDFIRAFMGMSREWFNLHSVSGHIMLVNNGIRAEKFELLKFFSGARSIVVGRGARDQFCARAIEGAHIRGTDDVERFITMIERTREIYSSALKQHQGFPKAGPILQVQFETFVTEESVRDNVLDFVGLGSSSERSAKIPFDPLQSQKNVGIHTGWHSASDIALIESRLDEGFFQSQA
jgi:hypothetical protein